MNKVTWHKSAAKDVRPFFGAAALERSLDSAEIRLFEDAPFHSATSFLVEPQDAERLCLSIRPNLNPVALAAGSITKGDLLLAVTAAQPFIRKTCVVATIRLADKLPDEISIGDELLSQLGGGSNLTVDIALCLAKHLPKKPGSPFLLGHWLSKKSFLLRQPKPADELDVVPMDDEAWKQIGWPAKTLYKVDYFGGINEPAVKGQIAKVRVHADIYKKLSLESSQRLAKPMMAMLAAEISSQILAASFSDWEHADEVVPLSPLSAFLKRIDRVLPCDLNHLKSLVKQPGMDKLKALLHSDQQSVRYIAEG